MRALFIRSAHLNGFRSAVRELGKDPEEILKKIGINSHVLDNPENIISFDTSLRLLNLTAEETGCAYFGLELSKHLDLTVLGTIGLLLQHSDTVGDALNALIKYTPTRFRGSEPGIIIDGGLAYLYNYNKYSHEDTRQNMYLTAGVGLKIMRALCGENWKPVEMHTIYSRQEYADLFIRYFNAPFLYNQDRNQMVFDARDLEKKITEKLGRFGQYVHPLLKEESDSLPTDIVSQTEQLILALLPEGKCSIDNVVSLMSVSERTFQRQLKARGTSFRKLVEDVRKSIALQQIRHSDLTQSQLAYVLGYTELSAFTRAFKRWFGVPPSQWKDL